MGLLWKVRQSIYAFALRIEEGTQNIYTYPMESDFPQSMAATIPTDPRVDALVNDLIGRVADKWTLLILEVLEEGGTLRFTQVAAQCRGSARRC
jgi:hypothetical protein